MNDEDFARLERKIDRLLARRRVKDSMQRTRQNQKVSRKGNTIKQLKVEKLALLKYIKELEGFMNIQDEKIRVELQG